MDWLLVPSWVRTWYLINVILLIPDWFFIVLRPRTLEGGDLAFLFAPFHLYARVDALFREYKDKVVKFIYTLGAIDVLLCCYLYATFNMNVEKPWFALACICREVFVLTKTALYLMYSMDFILPAWRVPVFLMNSQWVFVPMVAVFRIAERISFALETVDAKSIVNG